MSHVHRIHLGNAWEPPAAGGGGGWRRHFGLPTGIGPGTRVWLVIEQPAACAVVLNAHVLPTPVAGIDYRHEVGGLLARRNELVLVFGAAAAATTAMTADRGRRPLPDDRGRVGLEIADPAA